MTPQELAEKCAKLMWDNDTASQTLGMKLEEVAPGHAQISMTITETMANGQGNCHGGYIFTLADSAFAFACNTYNQITVAQHCAITFLSPGRTGDRLTARASEVSRRKRTGLYDIQITNQHDALVARFTGHSATVKGTHLPE